MTTTDTSLFRSRLANDSGSSNGYKASVDARPLTLSERATLQRLTDPTLFEGAAEHRAQIDHAMVVGRCDCACPTTQRLTRPRSDSSANPKNSGPSRRSASWSASPTGVSEGLSGTLNRLAVLSALKSSARHKGWSLKPQR